MSFTWIAQIPAEVNNFYSRTLLLRAIPLFVHNKWAQIKDIPANGWTDTIKFRRYSNLSAATTPLTEWITPSGSALSQTTITAQIAQYWDYVTLTDKVQFVSIDNVLMEAAEILWDQAWDTLDQLTRDVINAWTTVQRVNSRAARTDVESWDVIDVATIRKAIRTLKNAKARKMTKMVDASTWYSTVPLNTCYISIIHPNVSYTLKAVSWFTTVEKYPSQRDVMEWEIWSIEEVRFIESTNAKVFTWGWKSSIDVYSTLILAQEAYWTTRISWKAMENIIKPLWSGWTSDPLNQRSTSGWKATFVAKILNDAFMVRLESSAAA